MIEPDFKNIKVKKRNAEIEAYDPEKIKRVVMAAGLDEAKAEALKVKINEWAVNYKESPITSLQIRDQILVEIQKVDDYAAKKFIWWEKYKDKHFTK